MIPKISEEKISMTFQKALERQLIDEKEDTALIFYDESYLRERINDLVEKFPKNTLHAIAIKANPLLKTLRLIKKLGIGVEAATLPELYLAEKAGFPTDRIVFDSPTKTVKEIKYALNLGCHINVDSLYELDRVAEIMEEETIKSNSTIGIRINPQVGVGKIASTSVAGEYSKFGVPINENRQALIDKYIKYDWLRGIHLHIGSQGCSVEMLWKGIETVFNFVEEVNGVLEQENIGRRIDIFDIGGGLPVSYHKDKEPVSMDQYVSGIEDQFKELFSGNFRLITEFGRYIHANTGWVASKVEYVKKGIQINTAMIHVGAELFLRKCYRPEEWHHEILVLDRNGKIKKGTDKNKYVVAGPLCFAGDVIAKDIQLPVVEQGDYIIVQDAGAYTLSMWSRYNSRQIPKVIGYTEDGNTFKTLRKREVLNDILKFWS